MHCQKYADGNTPPEYVSERTVSKNGASEKTRFHQPSIYSGGSIK